MIYTTESGATYTYDGEFTIYEHGDRRETFRAKPVAINRKALEIMAGWKATNADLWLEIDTQRLLAREPIEGLALYVEQLGNYRLSTNIVSITDE